MYVYDCIYINIHTVYLHTFLYIYIHEYIYIYIYVYTYKQTYTYLVLLDVCSTRCLQERMMYNAAQQSLSNPQGGMLSGTYLALNVVDGKSSKEYFELCSFLIDTSDT